MLIALVAADSGAGASTWATATELFDGSHTGFVFTGAYRIVVGGDTNPVATHTTERSNHIAVLIPAAEWANDGTAPVISTVATGSSVSPDPTSVTFGWSATHNTIFIAVALWDDSAAPTLTAYPSGYTDNQVSNITATSAGGVACAVKPSSAASSPEDPGAFTLSGTETWAAYVIAVKGLALSGSSVSRTTTDAVTYADSAIRVVVLLRTTSDAVAHADVATRAVTLIRSVSDAIGLADAATQIKTILRSVSDAVGFSDAATRAGTFLRTATDAVAHSDAATRALALLRSATDAATYADAATQVRAIVRSASDAVGLSDAATRVGSFLRTAADSFSLSDVVEAIIGGAVTIGQAVLSFPLIYHATRIFDVIHAALFSLPIVHKATLASMALEYDLNDTVSPTCTFTVSDVNTDPTTISLTVREPDGTTTTYTYAGATITKTSTGVYTKNITLAKRGVWLFQWAGTGACQASAEGTVTVRY